MVVDRTQMGHGMCSMFILVAVVKLPDDKEHRGRVYKACNSRSQSIIEGMSRKQEL